MCRIVALDTGQWIGAEALLRWTDSEGVTHRPDVFINIRTFAEGVEAREQVEFLQSLGVHYAQGWFYSRALDFDEFIHFYAAMQSPMKFEHTHEAVA
jgi:sensor c-di-GMP phosphodiesterase-like protein